MTSKAERAMADLASEHAEAMAVRRRVEQVTSALDEVARFADYRGSPLALLAGLAAALPAESAIVTLRVDSVSVAMVALSSSATMVVTRLERSGFAVSPEIVGPVTRERAGGREVERVTIRFRLTDSAVARASS
jgi:hypothetical protein